MNGDDMIPYVIIASCVLHNICLSTVDNIEDFIAERQEPVEVLPKFELLLNELADNKDAGVAKRKYLAWLVS